ncbi:MAG: S1C family serine protease [Candidatus Bathyarchaeia archaeon]
MLPRDEAAVLEIVEKVSRSVVNVSTVRLVHDVFYRAVPVKGMGSGTIIDPKGYVLTNNHVIEGARRIEVTLATGEVLPGRLTGSCKSDDIAVIKVKSEDLPAAELGDSDKLRVGQTVFAIGNPFGLAGGPTVTAGVISAINRSIKSKRGVIENLVQTDAAINPGNSGGPLVDIHGKVVAINTAIIPFAQGIGFAIPVNTVKRCSNEIIVHGMVIRPWLGITGLSLTRERSAYYGLPVEKGVLVTGTVSGGPADRAGITSGDIIRRLDGTPIDSIEDLQKEIHKRRVGERVGLLILRDAQRGVVEVTLERTP